MPSPSWKRLGPLSAVPPLAAALWAFGSPLGRAWIVALAFLCAFSGLVMGAVARWRAEPAARLTWAGVLVFGILGSFNWFTQALELIQFGEAVPFPAIITLVAWVPALSAITFALLAAPPRRTFSASRFLDGAVFTLAAYLGLWMWVLQPMMAGHHLPLPETLGMHGVFLIACVAQGVGIHVWVERGDRLETPVAMLALGVTYCAMVLPWWVGTLVLGTFTFAHPVRLVFVPGFILLALSTRMPWRPEAARPIKALRFLLPYLPTTVAFGGFLVHYLPQGADRDTPGFVLLSGLALLVLARQALTLRQIFTLNRTLEEKVEARTRELAQSQALFLETQQKNLVATLGAGITHDLNNLLGAAMGNLDLLRLKMGPTQDSREMDGLEKALERAGDLSKRLMGLAREGPGPSRTFDLLAHLEELNPLLRAMVPRNIQLTWEHDAQALPICANPGQVDQVLVNLVSNAKDATPPGGRISLRARSEGEEAVIQVQDTGTGIPDAVMQRLFEPFLTTKPSGKGTGLGLSSVQAVVGLLGGTIGVHSSPGVGTTFTIRLPKAS
ncbi:MAG TPA: HAMP domain-containing sensor histidine kinase [Holophagaceae bacterium]|nr:HAMP domain-containing sensor histidine kinase [Holophagaceae bacterium]